MKIVLIFLFYIYSSHCDAAMFYYRIPFRIQTYTPITMEVIKELATKNGMQKTSLKNSEKISFILRNHKGNCNFFDKKNIRIYIKNDNHEYFIDNNGMLAFKDKKKCRCSENKINENSIVNLLNEGNIDRWMSND
ncbi:hypothetical protein [Obesumbacterium proteus]|uniref:hypothetical protein n=1 Tax=Obesumbacterium proteus TaxID=82983 RepID=UPI001F3750F9|nr:hypothetical protein [Obesumbacterium proteus]MCE9883907.1 hypothetical protein [Obesumbacterium proteus]MCE9918201.1 hypothetical protein [Obesumbacterium proteus]MCE9931446.1 hypothetical protein [Obesumbacterium proteus]